MAFPLSSRSHNSTFGLICAHMSLDNSEVLLSMLRVFFFKYWSWKLLKFALIQSAVLWLSHKDTISNDVYDGGMVFYKRLFLDNKLFTLHSSVFAIFFFFFVPSKSTNSIFAMLESPWRFCTDQNFCNFDLFVAIYSKETTTKIIWI